MATRKVKTKSTKVVKQRTKKIVKTKGKKKAITRLSPKKKAVASKKSAQTPKKRVYYNISEDSQIVQALDKKTEKMTKSEIAKALAKTLGRTVESVRDRMKRFISRMCPADKKELVRHHYRTPEYYVHFQKPTSGYRKIEKIVADAPTLLKKKLKKKKKR